MKIVLMNGGLGNQLFQYAFYRYIQIATNDICYIDDSAFFGKNVEHNGFEIEKRKIDLKDHIKTLGTYTATLKLHTEVSVKIEVQVVPE